MVYYYILFFVYPESLVYTNSPKTLVELKNNIRVAIMNIDAGMLDKGEQNSDFDCPKVLTRDGATFKISFSRILYKKIIEIISLRLFVWRVFKLMSFPRRTLYKDSDLSFSSG